MKSHNVLTFGSFVLSIIAIGMTVHKIEKYLRSIKLGGRICSSDKDWFISNYGEMKDDFAAVIAARNKIGSLLSVEPSLMRIADKIADLNGIPNWFAVGTDVDDLEYEISVVRSVNNTIIICETVGDIIGYLTSRQPDN